MGKDVGNLLLGGALIGASFLIPSSIPFVGAALFGTGLGFASRAIFKANGLAERSDLLKQNVVSTVGELPVVYGTTRMGVHLADLRTQASNAKRLAVVGAVCHGGGNGAGISALKEIYLDDRLAVDASGTVQSAFKKSGTDLIKSIGKYLGTDTQTADSYLTTNYSSAWTSAHRGRGVAYLALVLEFDADIFSSLPVVTVQVEGRKVYDPRDHTVKYSANPVLCLRDYLMDPHYGLGAGRLVPFTSSQVAQSGLGSFTAANVGDGSTTATAWSTDAASSGATLRVDFGSAVELVRAAVWVAYTEGVSADPGTTDQYAGTYDVEYSDDDSAWSTAISGWTPRRAYRNEIAWGNRGAHRYWRLKLTNTPGAGAELTELEWYETELNEAAFISEANYCDELVSVPPADAAYGTISAATTATPIVVTQTAHGYSNGDQVDIKQVGLTAPGLNLLGTWTITVVDANRYSLDSSVGSGTYVANQAAGGKLVTQARFECHGALDTASPLEENLRQLLSSCRGQLVWEGGQFRPYIKRTGSAVLALTEDDVVGPLRIGLPGLTQQGNVGLATFLDPNKGYQPDTLVWPPSPDTNTFLAADAGFEVDLDFELALTQNRYTAEQIVMVGLRESRKAITVAATFRERLLQATVGDLVSFTHQTPGWAAKVFWLEAMAPRMDGLIEAVLTEYDSAAYSLDPHNQRVTPPATSLPDPYSVLAPAALTLAAGDAEMFFQPNGEGVHRIKCTGFTSADPYLAGYEVQAKRSTEADYEDWSGPRAGDTVFYVWPVNVGETWDLRIRAKNVLGRVSSWVTASVTVNPTTRTPPLGVVDFFDDYPGTRWSNTGTGGSSTVVAAPEAEYGGKVLELVASRTGEWVPYIPFDPKVLYAIRGRARCLVAATSGSPQDFFLGFKCYDNALNLLSVQGAGSGNSTIGAAANFTTIAASFSWTALAGYVRGWNGSWYAPPAGVLTNSGFNGYTAANVGDGSPASVAFHSDTATAGATLTIDLGSGVTKAFIRAKLYLNAGSGVAQYKVQYSDNGSSWSDVTFRSGATTWTPSAAGWNEIDWGYGNAGSAKHRYWRLYLNNTPGGGPDVMEFELLELADPSASAGPFADPDAPGTVPPGTAYIRPYFQARGGTLAGWANDCVHQIDIIEMPPAAGSTALL